jgi:hypothetical protein
MRWLQTLFPWLLMTAILVGLVYLDQVVTTTWPISPSRVIVFGVTLLVLLGIFWQAAQASPPEDEPPNQP